MLNFEKVISNGSKVLEVAAKSVMDLAKSKGNDNEQKPVKFLKSWEQEFGGARTIDEINEYEFRVKCEGIRFMLEMITDSDGFINQSRRKVTLDYVTETGLTFGVGICNTGKENYKNLFISGKPMNVLDMDADYAFCVYMTRIVGQNDEGIAIRWTSPICMAYIPELRIVGGQKKVVYKMELINRSDDGSVYTEDSEAFFEAAGSVSGYYQRAESREASQTLSGKVKKVAQEN